VSGSSVARATHRRPTAHRAGGLTGHSVAGTGAPATGCLAFLQCHSRSGRITRLGSHSTRIRPPV